MTPNVEALVSSWLRSVEAVTDIVGEKGVHTVWPSKDADGPFVVLTLVAGVPAFSAPLWLDNSRLQVDCYGGSKSLARLLMDTCRAVLAGSDFLGEHDLGVVTGVTFGIAQYMPDAGIQPPRPRYSFDITIHAHPGDELGS